MLLQYEKFRSIKKRRKETKNISIDKEEEGNRIEDCLRKRYAIG